MAGGRPESLRSRLRRVRLTLPSILQASVAAVVAYYVAAEVLGHAQPFFAPIAAVITVGVSLGQRLQRTVEIALGVSLGVLLADGLIVLIGSGIWQMGVVVALAMTAAVFVGGGPVVLVQSASSAILVATLLPPTPDEPIAVDRFVDALTGGLVGLAISAVLVPVNPLRVARRAVDPLLVELAATVDDVAAALRAIDTEAGDAALARARTTQALVERMHGELEGSYEVARIAPVRWRSRTRLGAYLDAAPHLDNAARNTRVLARQSTGLLYRSEPVPPDLPLAIAEVAEAMRHLATDLAGNGNTRRAQEAAIRAATTGSGALDQTGGLYGSVVVAVARSLAVDVLLGCGVPLDEAFEMLPDLPVRRRFST